MEQPQVNARELIDTARTLVAAELANADNQKAEAQKESDEFKHKNEEFDPRRAAYRAVAGDLKLAYAPFEELETFSRFGARLDEAASKVIEHGRRIRACLKQPELARCPGPRKSPCCWR